MGANADNRVLLRTMLADCTYFRDWHGQGWDQATALSHIYYGGLPRPAGNKHAHSIEELNQLRPYAIIGTEALGHDAVAVATAGGANKYRGHGIFTVLFERVNDADDNVDPGVTEQEIIDELDDIMRSGDTSNPGLCELSGQSGYLDFHRIEGDGPFRIEPELVPDYGDALQYYVTIEWGGLGGGR